MNPKLFNLGSVDKSRCYTNQMWDITCYTNQGRDKAEDHTALIMNISAQMLRIEAS